MMGVGKVKIEIIDVPSIGSPAKRKSDFIITCKSNNTLYINGRWIDCPLGRLIYIKGLLDKEIENYNREAKNHTKINIPKRIYFDNELSRIEKSNGLPNIILKNIYIDQKKGIRLLFRFFFLSFLEQILNS